MVGFGGAVILSEPLARVLNAQNGAVLEQWPRTEVTCCALFSDVNLSKLKNV